MIDPTMFDPLLCQHIPQTGDYSRQQGLELDYLSCVKLYKVPPVL